MAEETDEMLALAEVIRELERMDDLQGMWGHLEGIVEDHGLEVKTNKGGPNARTLEQFRDDIIAALEDRLEMARVTAQLEEAQIQELEPVALGNWEQEAFWIEDELRQLTTDEDIRDEGGLNYLRRIIRLMDLRRVNNNVGGWDPVRRRVVTLMHVKDDILEELFDRMPDEHEGTPDYYNNDGELITNQPILTDAEDSDVGGQAEQADEEAKDDEDDETVSTLEGGVEEAKADF